MEIITLLKANIRYKKGSFISVLILTLLISLCLTTVISINYNIQKRADDALKEVKAGDLTAILWDVQYSDTMLQKAKDNRNVDHVEVVNTITQELEINGEKQGSSTFFTAFDPEGNPYQIYDNSGLSFIKHPEALKQGEIYVPISFKLLYDCKIGDTAYFSKGDTARSFTVKGFFEEPFIGAEWIGIKLVLMNGDDFDALYSQRCMEETKAKENKELILGYDFIKLYQTKDSHLTISDFKKSINADSKLIDYAFFSISKEQSKAFTVMFTQIFSGIMAAFLILLFLVVLIVMGHSISTGIEMDYTNLGVLKAIGFTKGSLRKLFVLEYVIAEVIGAVIGMAGSIPATYYLNTIFIRMTGLLSSVNPAFVPCFLIMGAVVLVSAFYIFLKTKAIIRVSPVRAISGGRESIYFHSRLELPVEGRALHLRMALRQLTSNLKQYVSSTLIVAILVFFLVAITELNSSMDKKTIEESFGGVYFDLEVLYNSQGEEQDTGELKRQVEADISGISSIKNSFQISNQYFIVNGDEYHGSIYTDPTLIKSILKGRAPIYDNEIVVTEIVADELGVDMGDTVTVGNEDLEEKYLISGIFQCTNDMGRTVAITQEGVKKIMPDYRVRFQDYIIADSKQSAAITKLLKEKYGNKIEVIDVNAEEDFDVTITTSLRILNMVIYVISIVFAFIVILIVCSKIFLKEQTDYGIYKAIGFTSATLRLQFALRFAVIAFLGSIIGILANIVLNNAMMSALLGNVGITSYTSKYSFVSLLLPVAVLTVCFFLFAYLVSGKIKRVDTKNLICES
jgi:ABC-type antimicrobial peptide transport system permease subunit